MQVEKLKQEIDELARRSPCVDDLMLKVCQQLHEKVPTYSWVGFYMINHQYPQFLQLGTYAGDDTPHKRIRLDQGICGAAASNGTSQIVNDVTQDPRYLVCSVQTKSEAVVPISVAGQVVGIFDIDSCFLNAFAEEDRQLIEHCAVITGTKILEERIQAAKVQAEIEEIEKTCSSADQFTEQICKKFIERVPKYHWVGFYMIDKNDPDFLQLGPSVGRNTPHQRIRMNQGICGAAASSGITQIVNDVRQDPRYLACSSEAKSEIVVPVFVNNNVVGELDIDSNYLAAFKESDRILLEHSAKILGRFIEKQALPGSLGAATD